MDVSRRDFIKLSSSMAAGGALGARAGEASAAPVMVAQGAPPTPRGFDPGDPALKYELVIAGGEVLDPSQKLRAKRDIGIKYGQIAALLPSIPADRAVQRIDAAGKLVTPGLIDLHTHLCPHLGIGLPADEIVGISATTTAVSAGDAGAHTFGNFRHGVVPQSRTRLYGFVHIASIGLAGGLAPGEMLNIDYANVEACAKVAAENADLVLGVKVRITDSVVGQNGLEPLRRALRAAEQAGKSFRVMCHIGAAPGSLADLLDLLRPGDILTHAYSGAGNNTVQNGRVLPAALAAKQRGVLIDVGHGGGSFDYTMAEPALAQGFTPDTISSDIHAVSINTPGYPTLPWVMSKFLNMGLSLEDVVAKATVEPGRIIGRVPGLGTLQIGAPADISIFDLVDGPVEFVDTRSNKRSGTKKLVPVLTVRGGRPFGRPPLPVPFLY
ncbi:MAG TPA: amidohydrolase/deacetylase family metallohydrolase [Methylomirabilota bacterium]|jgi:dihydroorotase|nr:amidohydrolase/deacetylase family metallohydrolase [Methylomirabilota bacterium]